MPRPLEPFKIRNLGIYGVIRRAEVDDYIIPEGAVIEAVNVHFDRKGAATLRNGYANLGGVVSAGTLCLGAHNVQDSTLIVVFEDGTNNDGYYYNGTDWSKTLVDDTAGSKTRFVDFGDRTIRVNGVDGSIKAWAGKEDATWEVSGSPVNPDDMWGYVPKYIETYKSRVYLAGDSTYPKRLFFSSVVDSTGTITFTPTDDYVDFWQEGENISALKRFSTELLVFKPNHLYRFKTSGADPDPLIRVGTRSQESVIEGKRGLYFHHDSGIYRYSGGYPQEISRTISDIVDAITVANADDVVAWKDSNHVYWSVGDLTIAGDSWTNVVCRYTESSDVWTIYQTASEITWASNYNNGSTLVRVIGDDAGYIHTWDSGNTDNGTGIGYRVITKWYEFGNVYEKKVIQQIIGLCEKAQGSRLFYQVDDDSKSWKDLGQLKKFLTDWDSFSIEFNRIRFKLTGVSKVEPFIWLGLEIPKGIIE